MSVFSIPLSNVFSKSNFCFSIVFSYIYQLQPIGEPITELTTDNLATILIVEQYLVTPASCG